MPSIDHPFLLFLRSRFCSSTSCPSWLALCSFSSTLSAILRLRSPPFMPDGITIAPVYVSLSLDELRIRCQLGARRPCPRSPQSNRVCVPSFSSVPLCWLTHWPQRSNFHFPRSNPGVVACGAWKSRRLPIPHPPVFWGGGGELEAEVRTPQRESLKQPKAKEAIELMPRALKMVL